MKKPMLMAMSAWNLSVALLKGEKRLIKIIAPTKYYTEEAIRKRKVAKPKFKKQKDLVLKLLMFLIFLKPKVRMKLKLLNAR